ncbi:glycerate kinase [Algoriphagus lutimaris]|uniref:glycerate kinase family protein n=1 Tax=Algoriphagus lutimaris TaxID=613197 RepID=UPI00196B74D7|nr:glycerate kinase [Algoriphagus lutimaris]MBN3519057.1 glycerate kinase [Algoriphagus lutimaris]
MNVLIAPNAFKGTLSAIEAGEIIASSIRSRNPKASIEVIPIGDGGDGTCELLGYSLGLTFVSFWCLNAVGKPVLGSYYLNEDKAYIDVSAFSGLGQLPPHELDIKVSSTYGTGQAIQHAISKGAKEIILGLGGSATIDLGIGILQALGIHFLDANGRNLIPFSKDFLFKIKHIQKGPKIPKVKFTCLCDVKNTFGGPDGAIPVFGPQKGLISEEISKYENQCELLLEMMYRKSNLAFQDKSGFGAAGGIAAGLSGFFETKIETGATYFFGQISLEKKLEKADFLITGEGRYDNQSKSGKACFELLKLAEKYQKPIFLITSGEEALSEEFTRVYQLPDLNFQKNNFREVAKKNLKEISQTIDLE